MLHLQVPASYIIRPTPLSQFIRGPLARRGERRARKTLENLIMLPSRGVDDLDDLGHTASRNSRSYF
jgi:hypothetical protein